LATTQKISYRDALKQTKVDEAITPVVRAPVAANGATAKNPVVERKSVCTQTDDLQQGTTQTHEPTVTGLTGTQNGDLTA